MFDFYYWVLINIIMNNEVWKPAKGYEGIYEVSSKGQVARLAGDGCRNRRIRKQQIQKSGYKFIMMYKDGVRTNRSVHSLVADAFLDNKKGMHVDHINGDQLDNSLENLRVVTQSENLKGFRRKKKGSSRYRGVSFDKETGLWLVRLDNKYVGRSDNEYDAARIWNFWAKKKGRPEQYLNII